MHTVKSDGYISDDEGVQYPLHNVLAIRWKLVNEIVGESRYKDRYRIWFSDDEIEGMGVPIMENRGEFE